jgi:dihydroxyacid dehydratase/phosphogluconate dehydratase
MDASANIKSRLPSRPMTEGPARAPHRSYLDAMGPTAQQIHPPFVAMVAVLGVLTDAALHLPAIANECGINLDLFDAVEIFKKTPCAAGLKPGGRYVAKDMDEIGSISLLMKTPLDDGDLHGDCITVTGRTTAENLKSVKGGLAPKGAIVRVAAMLQDSDIIGIDGEAEASNVKLTDAERADLETKWQPRATNHRSGALWKYAQRVGPAVDGAVTHPGGAHEKQYYADI